MLNKDHSKLILFHRYTYLLPPTLHYSTGNPRCHIILLRFYDSKKPWTVLALWWGGLSLPMIPASHMGSHLSPACSISFQLPAGYQLCQKNTAQIYIDLVVWQHLCPAFLVLWRCLKIGSFCADFSPNGACFCSWKSVFLYWLVTDQAKEFMRWIVN